MPTTTTPQDVALAQVQAYCGWHIAPELEETIVLDGPGTGVLILPSLNVVEVAWIKENEDELEADQYSWSASGIVRRADTYWRVDRQPRWTNRFRGLEVKFTHGYETMPLEVQAVVDNIVARKSAAPPTGLASRTVGPFTESYSSTDQSALASDDRGMLARYRLPWTA